MSRARSERPAGAARKVLVTDVEERSSLAACRGLAWAGYEVTGVAGMTPAAGHWSRSCHHKVTLPDPRDRPETFIDGLVGVLTRDRHTLLMPGTDLTLWLISEARERFEGLVGLPLPDRAAVAASLDKRLLMTEASRLAGLDAPASIVCTDGGEALDAATELGFPVVVKPAFSFSQVDGRYHQTRVAVARDASALAAVVPRYGSSFVVQRYVQQSSVISSSGVMAGDGLLGFATVRWERRWPVASGAASFCRTVAPPAGLAGQVEQLLRHLRFEGIFELELLELADGTLAAIDLNPRPFGWMSLPIAAGANLPALLCDHVLGDNPAPAVARADVPYRWEDGDALHFAAQLRRGRLGAAAAVLRPHRHVVHAHFRVDDPWPLAARVGILLRMWARGRRGI